MTNAQAIVQRDRTEEELVAWLQTKSPEELREFLASPWVASLLSSETIEELYQQEASQLDRAEEYVVEVGRD